MSDDLDELFDATGDANDFDPHFEASLRHRVEMREEIIEALTAENRRLRDALQTIVDSYEATHELHTSHADCAANLYDHARFALRGEQK